jgi:signal transduction histidine kinase
MPRIFEMIQLKCAYAHKLSRPTHCLNAMKWLILICVLIASMSLKLIADAPQTITNLFQVRQLGLQSPGVSFPIQLEGQVCWVDSAHKTFALIDNSGGIMLKMDWLDQPLRIGQRLSLTGAATFMKAGNIFKIGVNGMVVEVDGIHPMTEKSGAVFLEAGKVPLCVDYFNGLGDFGLKVNYEGPDAPRREFSPSELFRHPGKTINWVNGLDYRCYEGLWNELPDFNELTPVKIGITDNFKLNVRIRDERVGLEFTGFFEAPHSGLYKFYLSSDDGSRLSLGKPDVQMKILGQEELPAPRHIFIGQILNETQDGSWSQIEGKVTQIWVGQNNVRLELSVGMAHMEASIENWTNQSSAELMGCLVQATGFCLGAYNSDGLKVPNLLLVPDSRLLKLVDPSITTKVTDINFDGLPVLTKAVEVHQLKREVARLKYPARIRGVVTSIDSGPSGGITVQDSTGGLYIHGAVQARVGEFVEVEGLTDPGVFAPMLTPSRIKQIGSGQLPEPVRPFWDQLMNGSLDAQYVEIEGIVTMGSRARMQLLTHGGTITLELMNGLGSIEMKQYENLLIRVRGVLLPNWNPITHQVIFGESRLFNPTITVESPTPAEMQSIPSKTPGELLQFDPQASLFERTKMSGQIVHMDTNLGFMMAENKGIRFVPKTAVKLQPGDLVEVVGFPILGGASPLLREAVVRKTGHAVLPAASLLPPDNLTAPQFDATRVSVTAVLTGIQEAGTRTLLEMQCGLQNFLAHLDGNNDFLRSLPVGSQLQLTGVYSFEDGNQILDRKIGSFELLLDSAADIKVLARPPWWTLRRLVSIVGVLACVLAAAVLWITQLHRKVEDRTVQLKKQIQKRLNIEQSQLREQERARIAQDLHDELGSGLTEIGMLATLPALDTALGRRPADQITTRAKEMVSALDEIVWAMNPKHDSLESLGSYLCLYADRFLKLANITCHLKGNLDLPDQPLNPIHRHEFFLAFKEALTNIVRHSNATEVRLKILIIGNKLRLSLADNGGGLNSTSSAHDMDGLNNMRMRLEKIGGGFGIASQPGRGTTLRFYLPLN